MRIEVHVPLDTEVADYEDALLKAARVLGYNLRRSSGQLLDFQSTIVVETNIISGRQEYEDPVKYIAISTEVYKLEPSGIGNLDVLKER